MKTKILIFLILIIYSFAVKAQSTLINFEDTSTLKFISIDTANHSNIWQIGNPDKVLFNSAFSTPNCIITDTINSYPTNNNSVFLIKAFFGLGSDKYLRFNYKINTDTLNDYGTIEESDDQGATWIDIIKNAQSLGYWWQVERFWNGTIVCAKPDTLAFTGSSYGGWYIFTCTTGWTWTTDTVLYRITFHSDSIQTNKEGWLIDDISLVGADVGIKDIKSNNFYSTALPNPTNDWIKIKFDNFSNSALLLNIYNSGGEKIRTINTKSNEIFVDMKGENRGLYYYQIFNSNINSISVGKFIKL